jgi:hypothetical protein
VICGLNPGTAKQAEKDFILENGRNYAALVKFWHKKIKEIRYFDRPRKLVRGLGRAGPIFWTDVVRCENESKEVSLDFRRHSSTFRRCTSKFLLREMALARQDWLVVCLGWKAYRAVTYMFPNRPTLGVPHPTGPYSRFLLFFDSKGNLKNSFKKQILNYFAKAPNGTLWVDPRSTS